MKIPIEEQETIIRFGRTDERAEICTTDTRYMNKYDKMVKESSDWEFKKQETCEGDVVEKFYTCPVGYVCYAKKKRLRVMTEKQRQEGAERLRRYREAHNQK